MMKQAELITALLDKYTIDLIAGGVLMFWNAVAAGVVYGLVYAAVWILSGAPR